MKVHNYYIYNDDEAVLKQLEEEYIFMGRSVKREEGQLVVFALARKKKRKKTDKKPSRRY